MFRLPTYIDTCNMEAGPRYTHFILCFILFRYFQADSHYTTLLVLFYFIYLFFFFFGIFFIYFIFNATWCSNKTTSLDPVIVNANITCRAQKHNSGVWSHVPLKPVNNHHL